MFILEKKKYFVVVGIVVVLVGGGDVEVDVEVPGGGRGATGRL